MRSRTVTFSVCPADTLTVWVFVVYNAALVVNVYVPAFTAWNVKVPFALVVVVRPPGLNETVAPEIGVPSRLLTTVPVITPGAGWS